MTVRPRRLRQSELLRNWVHETDLNLKQLVQPYFLEPTQSEKTAIQGFTGIFRWPVEPLVRQVGSDLDRGVSQFILFGSEESSSKDATGTNGAKADGLVQKSVRALKKQFGKNILLITDVCLCPYTSHGHCGLLQGDSVANDESLEPLAQMAVSHAEAGADLVAPSDMMDGRVGFIRAALDQNNFASTGILAYTAKYASQYYGPFREALGSSPQVMDRASYQMDPRNSREALRELELDIAEGADIVMVKPALPYLDIIQKFRERSNLPIAAYSVSGEYEMVKQMALRGLANEPKLVLENLTAIRRAGAQIIITYYAGEIAERGWLR